MRRVGQAAAMGDARAMSNLALMYESGKWGKTRDEFMALKLYRWETPQRAGWH